MPETQLIRRAWWKNVEVWFYGGAAAAIGGGASSVAAVIVDPKTFNLNDGVFKIMEMFVTSGLVNLMFFLAKSPLPKLPSYEENITTPPAPPAA